MADYQENLEKILGLLKDNPRGLNIREIAELIGMSRISIAKYLDVLAAEGKIEVRTMGKAKIFYVIQVSTPPSLLNRIPSMILVLGADARIIQANDHFLTYYSLTQEMVFGQPLSAVPAGILREPVFLRALDDVIRTGAPVTGLNVTVPPDNGTFTITVKPTPPANDRSGIIVIINEIPGERPATDGARSREEMFQPFMEQIGVPACIVQDGKIRLANARFAMMSGYGSRELMSRSFRAFIHPDDLGTMPAWPEPQMQETLTGAPAPFRGITKSGSVIRLDARTVPFSWERQPASLVFLSIMNTG